MYVWYLYMYTNKNINDNNHLEDFTQAYLNNSQSLYEPFYGKTYKLDWRHNLLKRRHNSREKFLTCFVMVMHVYFNSL